MASCNAIIVSALRKLGIVGGVKAPRDADLQLGLQRLQSWYLYLITSGALGRKQVAVPQTPTYICREFDHVYRRGSFVTTVELPDLIETYNGEAAYGRAYDSRSAWKPRPPRNGAFVIISDQDAGTTSSFIYEGYAAKWVAVDGLSLAVASNNLDVNGNVISITPESTAPLSMMGDAGLAACLAVYMADDFGVQPQPTTIRAAQDFKNVLMTEFGDVESTIPYEYF